MATSKPARATTTIPTCAFRAPWTDRLYRIVRDDGHDRRAVRMVFEGEDLQDGTWYACLQDALDFIKKRGLKRVEGTSK